MSNAVHTHILTVLAAGSADAAPERIMLFPQGGAIRTRDGRAFAIDFARLMTRFQADGLKVPLDINHATEILAPKGERADPVGFVTALEQDGAALYGRVEWIDPAAAPSLLKAYPYVSPAFPAPNGEALWLKSVALVASPALAAQPALAQADPSYIPENPMKTVLAALGLRVDAAQALSEAQKAQGRANLGAQATLGYAPANKAGDTFAGNVTIGTAVFQTDGNIAVPWAGGRYLHQMLPYFVDTWFPDNQGAPRLSYQASGTIALRGAGGTDRTALTVQRGGDGAALFQVEGSGDLYVSHYATYLSTVLTRAKNIRLGGRSFWDIRIDAGPWDHIAVFGEVMVGLHSYPADDGSRNIAGFYYAALQQQDVWGNWYGVTAG